jgi:hypothetical protein
MVGASMTRAIRNRFGERPHHDDFGPRIESRHDRSPVRSDRFYGGSAPPRRSPLRDHTEDNHYGRNQWRQDDYKRQHERTNFTAQLLREPSNDKENEEECVI